MASNTPSISWLLSTHAKGYHASGTIRRGRQIVARYYTCDSISPEALAEIRQHYPHATTGSSSPEYAPEIRRPVLIVPTAAEMARKAS